MSCRACGAPLFTEETAIGRCFACRRDEILPGVLALQLAPARVARLDALYRLGRIVAAA